MPREGREEAWEKLFFALGEAGELCDTAFIPLDGVTAATWGGAEACPVEAPDEETGAALAAPIRAPAGRTMNAQTTNTIGNSQSALRPDGNGDIADGEEAW